MIVGETGGYLYPSTVTGFKGKINCLNIGSNAIYIRQGKAPDGCLECVLGSRTDNSSCRTFHLPTGS